MPSEAISSYLLPLGGRERDRNEIVEQTEDDSSVIPKPRSGHLRHVTNAYSGLERAMIGFVKIHLFFRNSQEVIRFTGPQSHISASVNVSAADETVPCGFLLRRYRYIGFQLVKRLRPTPFARSMLL